MKDSGRMRQMRSEIIHIDKAEAATFREIALYLFTGGKFGRVLRAKRVALTQWTAPQHINCRCQPVRPFLKGDEQ